MTSRPEDRQAVVDEIRQRQAEQLRKMTQRRDRAIYVEEIRTFRGLEPSPWKQLEIRADALKLARERLSPGPAEERTNIRRELHLRQAVVDLLSGAPSVTVSSMPAVRAGSGLASVSTLPNAKTGDGRTLTGYATRWNQPARIADVSEGLFIERLLPGSWTASLKRSGGSVVALHEHGQDPQIGKKPLGRAAIVESRDGPVYELPVIDATYTGDVLAAAREQLLGTSFSFRVVKETWNQPTTSTPENPEALPERSIHACDVFEISTVVWPAYANTTAAVRETPNQLKESA